MDDTLISVFPVKTAVSAIGVAVEVPYSHPARQMLVVIQYSRGNGLKINAGKC